MWHYSIVNLYLILLLQNTYSANRCACSEQNVFSHRKGETGKITDYKEKRQLDIEEVNGTLTETEIIPTDGQTTDTELESLVANLTHIELKDDTTIISTIAKAFNWTIVSLGNISTVTSSIPETTYTTEMSTSVEVRTTTDIHNSNILYSNLLQEINENLDISESFDTSEIADTNYISFPKVVSKKKTFEDENITETTTVTTQQETTTQNETIDDTKALVDCNKYKKIQKLEFHKMADVWKITYYTMPQVLKCFKLLIKVLTNEDQANYAKRYGNFNNKILWDSIWLEILSTDINYVGVKRKHFLQSLDFVDSVMRNIVIEEETFENTTSTMSLVQEVSDQWMIVKNLLLMRDCESGDIVMFSRLSYDPKITEIEKALAHFNESSRMVGSLGC